MGLNIGIRVKKQREEYMSYGCNPKGSREEIEMVLWEELAEKFPKAAEQFSLSVTVMKDVYDFDVGFVRYARGFCEAGYSTQDMYIALADYILRNFSADYGIDMHVYHSP